MSFYVFFKSVHSLSFLSWQVFHFPEFFVGCYFSCQFFLVSFHFPFVVFRFPCFFMRPPFSFKLFAFLTGSGSFHVFLRFCRVLFISVFLAIIIIFLAFIATFHFNALSFFVHIPWISRLSVRPFSLILTGSFWFCENFLSFLFLHLPASLCAL